MVKQLEINKGVVTNEQVTGAYILTAVCDLVRIKNNKLIFKCPEKYKEFYETQFSLQGTDRETRYKVLDVMKSDVFEHHGLEGVACYDTTDNKYHIMFAGLHTRNPLKAIQDWPYGMESHRREATTDQTLDGIKWVHDLQTKHGIKNEDIVVGGFSTGTMVAYAMGAMGYQYEQVDPPGGSPTEELIQSIAELLDLNLDAAEQNIYSNLTVRLLNGFHLYNYGEMDNRDIGKVVRYSPSSETFNNYTVAALIVDNSVVGRSHLVAPSNPVTNFIGNNGSIDEKWIIDRIIECGQTSQDFSNSFTEYTYGNPPTLSEMLETKLNLPYHPDIEADEALKLKADDVCKHLERLHRKSLDWEQGSVKRQNTNPLIELVHNQLIQTFEQLRWNRFN